MWWDGISARHHRGILAMPRSRAAPKALEDERAPMRALGSKAIRIGSHRQPLQTRAAAQVVNQGRDAAPPASQDSAAPAAFLWMQWRLRRANGSAAARRPYPACTSALSRGCCGGRVKKTGTGFSARCPFEVLKASINDGRSRGVHRRHHRHRHGGHHDHRRHRHGSRGEGHRSVHRRHHHRLQDGLREDGLR